jgi:flagellar hook-associated protein 1 FlgK
LAFSSPLATEADLGNIGNGSISPGELLGLEDVDGNPLSVFTSSGEMSPPLVVVFTSSTSYDVLDNSDPSNPVDLDPPIRNRRYLPGSSNAIFTSDMEQTLVASKGLTIGLPPGSTEITQASLQIAAAGAPSYGVSDFSGSANQFAFDVVVSGTGTSLDKTTTIVIANAAIMDDASLLADINNDLTGNNSGVTAYINDAGTLAFRLDTVGDGQITLNNYDDDPDGGADLAPGGQADTLLGFAIESTNFTTVGNADGVSGVGSLTNNYPTESLTFTYTDPETGTITSTPVFANANASARETANLISSVSGVSASARNYLEVSNLKVNGGQPLQMSLNGEDLLEYSSSAGADYPDPSTDPVAFNAYMAERINSNSTLGSLGIHAVGGTNPVSGKPELRVYSSEGDDLVFAVSAATGESADVSDGVNNNVTLNGSGTGTQSSILVGGSIDVTLSADLTMSSNPSVSSMFGDSGAADFAQSTYRGIQAEVSGNHQAGDKFTLDFNTDGVSDNRNALNMGNLQTDKTIDDGRSTYSENYAKLVEQVGIETSAAEINSVAAEQVLQQIEDLRNSISAVNLDEEAANLIQFEQIYNANAQVISVARDLFDRLLSIF